MRTTGIIETLYTYKLRLVLLPFMKYLYGFIVLHCHCIMQWSIAIVIARINGEHVLVEEVREELVACEVDCVKGSLEWRLWMRIAGERDE